MSCWRLPTESSHSHRNGSSTKLKGHCSSCISGVANIPNRKASQPLLRHTRGSGYGPKGSGSGGCWSPGGDKLEICEMSCLEHGQGRTGTCVCMCALICMHTPACIQRLQQGCWWHQGPELGKRGRGHGESTALWMCSVKKLKASTHHHPTARLNYNFSQI